MTSEQPPSAARAFGAVAPAYDRGRPGYPRPAVDWLVGGSALTVVELGAGTGKLTASLVEAGHDVHAVEPDEAMLAVLRAKLPDVRTSLAGAEEIPLPDRSADVVVCATSFHWFDPERALPEIARVLKPGGHLALVWNERDERIPWVRRLGVLLDGPPRPGESSDEVVVRSELFGFVDSKTFKFWQDINRETIVDLVLSRSYVASMDDAGRARKIAEVLELYDDYGRGMDGMQLPYVSRCFRSQVHHGDLFAGAAASDGEPEQDHPTGPTTDGSGTRYDPDLFKSDGTDTDMLLIDFR